MKKNIFKINFINETIEGTETAFKKAGNIDSREYQELKEKTKNFPNFKFKQIETKKNTSKNTYKGLTIELMREYVSEVSDKTIKAQFESTYDFFKKSYPKTKKWFIENVLKGEEITTVQEIEKRIIDKKNKKIGEGQTATDNKNNISDITEQNKAS